MSDHELAARDPVLAQLAPAAGSGLPPAGPELRCRPPVRFTGTESAGPTPMGALVVQEQRRGSDPLMDAILPAGLDRRIERS